MRVDTVAGRQTAASYVGEGRIAIYRTLEAAEGEDGGEG